MNVIKVKETENFIMISSPTTDDAAVLEFMQKVSDYLEEGWNLINVETLTDGDGQTFKHIAYLMRG